MKKFALFCMSLLPAGAFAVLPPLYTSIDQIKSMLEDPEISKAIDSGEYIERINRTADGFQIVTNKSNVQVKVSSLPQKMPGPAKFRFEFSQPSMR